MANLMAFFSRSFITSCNFTSLLVGLYYSFLSYNQSFLGLRFFPWTQLLETFICQVISVCNGSTEGWVLSDWGISGSAESSRIERQKDNHTKLSELQAAAYCLSCQCFIPHSCNDLYWMNINVPGVFRVKCQWCKNRYLFSSPQGSRNPTHPFHQPPWNTRSAPSLPYLQIIRGHCEGKVTAIAEYLISIRLRKIKWMLMRSAIQNMHYASWDRNRGGFSHVFIK